MCLVTDYWSCRPPHMAKTDKNWLLPEIPCCWGRSASGAPMSSRATSRTRRRRVKSLMMMAGCTLATSACGSPAAASKSLTARKISSNWRRFDPCHWVAVQLQTLPSCSGVLQSCFLPAVCCLLHTLHRASKLRFACLIVSSGATCVQAQSGLRCLLSSVRDVRKHT